MGNLCNNVTIPKPQRPKLIVITVGYDNLFTIPETSPSLEQSRYMHTPYKL